MHDRRGFLKAGLQLVLVSCWRRFASYRQGQLGGKWWVSDGKLWTSGALLNGTDLVHNLAKHYWGSGRESLVDLNANTTAWSDRDVDYKDVPVPVQFI